MNLREAIDNKDWSKFKKDCYPSFYNYYDELSKEIYSEGYISDDHYQAVEDSGRVEKYAIREWLCTDTNVGLYLYLVDGEPICIMHQRGRKSYPEWTFLSVDSHKKLKKLFDELRPVEESSDDVNIVDADMLNLQIEDELFGYDISLTQMLLSPIMNISLDIKYKVPSTEPEKQHIKFVIRYLTDHISSHNEFMSVLKVLDLEAYEKAKARSLDYVDYALKTLEIFSSLK
jgi:hypothetical protein